MSGPSIFWFRHDLRLSDLPGLAAAAQKGPVIPVFIFDEQLGGDWAIGGASRWWLHHSLQSLADSLEALKGRLVIRTGDTANTLAALVDETSATSVYCSRQYQPWADPLERQVKTTL